MGQVQTVYLPPWHPSTEAEKASEAEFADAIMKLSTAAANFIAPHPLHADPDFNFDWVEHRPFAEAAYRGDPRLLKLLPRLVPRRISEEDFWRNYFSHVFAVKRRFDIAAREPSPATRHANVMLEAIDSAFGTSASAAYAAEAVQHDELPPPSTPMSPAALLKTVSYPDKFDLALKYAESGPPLPNLSDADRILLEALQQQATAGECNRPRPGMWDTAEEKAKYEAWRKLGTMSKAEAMHLYVQAIEVFDEHWLEWRGLQPAIAAAVGAVTPAPNGAGPRAALDTPAALGTMRRLRHGLGGLTPAQLGVVRDECAALSRAIDDMSGTPATAGAVSVP